MVVARRRPRRGGEHPDQNGYDHARGVRAGPYPPLVASERVTAILKTTDVVATIDWYRRVGFEVRDVFPDTEAPTWCEVARDGLVLQFLGGETPWPEDPTFTGTIYVYPESVDALYEEIRQHTEPAWGPEDREWGARELGLRDPNGYFLTFTQPSGRAPDEG